MKQHAQRMLQPHAVALAVRIAESEQPPAGSDAVPTTVVTFPVPLSGTARIELPSLSATYSYLPSEASPLGCANDETLLVGLRRATADRRRCLRGRCPRRGRFRAFVERHFPDLVRPGHRDVQIVAVDPQIPGAVQRRLQRRADKAMSCGLRAQSADELVHAGPAMSLLAGAGDRLDSFLLQVDLAQHVILGIGHVEHVLAQRHALRMIEAGLVKVAVLGADLARADRLDQCAVELGDHDAVVIAVGDEQPVRFFVGQHLARKAQRRGRRLVGRQVEPQRRVVEQPLLLVVGKDLLKEPIERLELDLAAVARDEVALGIDHAQGRPALHLELVPDDVVGVVDHRVLDLVAEHGLGDVLRVLFGLELGRVDADHDDFVGIGLLELLQLGQDVHAVDAAVGPEIEQDELAAQLLEVDRPGRVDPLDAAVERRGPPGFRKWVFVSRCRRRLLGLLRHAWSAGPLGSVWSDPVSGSGPVGCSEPTQPGDCQSRNCQHGHASNGQPGPPGDASRTQRKRHEQFPEAQVNARRSSRTDAAILPHGIPPIKGIRTPGIDRFKRVCPAARQSRSHADPKRSTRCQQPAGQPTHAGLPCLRDRSQIEVFEMGLAARKRIAFVERRGCRNNRNNRYTRYR